MTWTLWWSSRPQTWNHADFPSLKWKWRHFTPESSNRKCPDASGDYFRPLWKRPISSFSTWWNKLGKTDEMNAAKNLVCLGDYFARWHALKTQKERASYWLILHQISVGQVNFVHSFGENIWFSGVWGRYKLVFLHCKATGSLVRLQVEAECCPTVSPVRHSECRW